MHHSVSKPGEAIDLVAFVNGLPIFTFELKNNITKQTVDDVERYQRDRDPREPLFGFGRTLAHFAVDDQRVKLCTELNTDYLWLRCRSQPTRPDPRRVCGRLRRVSR